MPRTIGTVVAMLLVSSIAFGETVGWRGDGSGRYPEANPPVTWSRTAKSVLALGANASQPAEGDAGTPIPDGVIREWLVLGPVPLPEGYKKMTKEVLPGEGDLAPVEKDRTGDHTWRKVSVDTSCLHFAELFNVRDKKARCVAYASAMVFSPSEARLALNVMHYGGVRVWLNGKAVFSRDACGAGRPTLTLTKGWNRLLLKVATHRSGWYVRSALYGKLHGEYESRNILWTTPTPDVGYSGPVIVGDRLFVTARRGALCCMRKRDGKVLWVRSSTYYDAATGEEKRAHPERFRELDVLAAQLRQFDETAARAPLESKQRTERERIQKKLDSGMRKVDDKRYASAPRGEARYTAPTPVTDGKNVIATFGSGLTVCFDLEGNRKWTTVEPHEKLEHGYTSSPLLADGKVILYVGDCRARDVNTGRLLWKRPRFLAGTRNRTYYHFHGSGCVVKTGNATVAYFPNNEFVRVSDGKTLYVDFWKLGNARYATPVVRDGVIYKIKSNTGGVILFKPSAIVDDAVKPEVLKTVAFDTKTHPRFYLTFYNASPLLHEGLMYCVDEDGVLTVVDTVKGEVLYQKLLDLDLFMHHNFGAGRGGAGASPTLAGKYIYLFGNQGTCLVIEPGRTFKQVAKNRIEHVLWPNHWRERQEITITCPVFDGSRMYYRAQENLYCIGK